MVKTVATKTLPKLSFCRFSKNVYSGTKKLCRLIKLMNETKIKNQVNGEISALETALKEDIDNLIPNISKIEGEVIQDLNIEFEAKQKVEERNRRIAEHRKRLEKEWGCRAQELMKIKQKTLKSLDDRVT